MDETPPAPGDEGRIARLFRRLTGGVSRPLAMVLSLALLATLLQQLPALPDRYRVVEDVQNSYWLARYQDPALFATDYLQGRYLIEVSLGSFRLMLYPRSPGYGLLFYLFRFAVDPIGFSKGLGFGLMFLSVWYLFRLGERVKNQKAAVSLSLLFVFFMLASHHSLSVTSGLQRAFAVPLLIVFLYYLVAGRHWMVGAMIFVGALFYLPLFPVMALAWTFSLVRLERPLRIRWAGTWGKAVAGGSGALLACLVVLLAMGVEFGWLNVPTLGTPFPPPLHEVASFQDIVYQSQEYAPLFIAFPFLGRAGGSTSGGWEDWWPWP